MTAEYVLQKLFGLYVPTLPLSRQDVEPIDPFPNHGLGVSLG